MVPSLKGAGGATPAGALGVTVGAGTASVESEAAAEALPAEPAGAFVCAGAGEAGAFAAGAVVGGAEVGVALACAQTGEGAKNRPAAKASVAVLKSLAVKSRICHPSANRPQCEDAPHPALSLT